LELSKEPYATYEEFRCKSL